VIIPLRNNENILNYPAGLPDTVSGAGFTIKVIGKEVRTRTNIAANRNVILNAFSKDTCDYRLSQGGNVEIKPVFKRRRRRVTSSDKSTRLAKKRKEHFLSFRSQDQQYRHVSSLLFGLSLRFTFGVL
jgi:hypothetical protein